MDSRTEGSKKVRQLLVESFVYGIGINTASPVIEFANNSQNRRLTLRINSELRVDPAPSFPSGLNPQQQTLLVLESLLNSTVTDAVVNDSAVMTITFSEEMVLTVCGAPIDSSESEPWILGEYENGEGTIVAQTGGKVAVFGFAKLS